MSPIQKITSNSSVTIALSVSFAAGAFWSGSEFSRIKAEMTSNSTRFEKEYNESRDWRKSTAAILESMRDLTRDNKKRLDFYDNVVQLDQVSPKDVGEKVDALSARIEVIAKELKEN
jgi:hypothetical protein